MVPFHELNIPIRVLEKVRFKITWNTMLSCNFAFHFTFFRFDSGQKVLNVRPSDSFIRLNELNPLTALLMLNIEV